MPKTNFSKKVLCFESTLLDKLGRFQGISTDVSNYFPTIITKPNYHFIERRIAEKEHTFKQIIPYVILLYDGDVFSYRRGKRGSETGLHELYSIGVGGHIEDDDTLLWSSDEVGYKDALWREVFEEVSISSEYNEKCAGLINDDSNKVGQLHFGIIHIVKLDQKSVSKKESIITDSGFMSVEKAKSNLDYYETWSQLCLNKLSKLI